MRGAFGSKALLVNGFFVLRGTFNGYPEYQKEDSPDCWLVVDKDDYWAVKKSESKEANDDISWCRCANQRRILLPTAVKQWTVWNSREKKIQSKVVASALV